MDDSLLIEFFADILSHRADEQLNLQNLTGHLSQLKKKNASFCMSKAELKIFFQKYNFIFSIDNKEIVHLLQRNVASHLNSKQNINTICDSKGTKRAALDGAAESEQENYSETTFHASRSSSCQRTSRLSSRESSLNRFGSQSSLCSSVMSADSSMIGTRVTGIIHSLQPKFGFIKADKKYNLEGFVYFGLHNVRNYGQVESLKDFFVIGQRVRFTVAAPKLKSHPTNKWAAKDITIEDIDSDSSSEVSKAESPSKRHCKSANDSDSAVDVAEIKGGHGVIENLFDNYGFIRQDETNKYSGNVFFPFRIVKGVPVGKSAKDVLEVGMLVTFDAETSLKKGSKAKWQAVHVWINQKSSLEKQNSLEDVYVSEDEEDSVWSLDKPSNNGLGTRNIPWNMREKRMKESGRIYPQNSTEALIKFGGNLDKIAFAISKVVYVGGSVVDDLIWCVDDGSQVMFNAISDQDCPAGYEWKATLVTVGSQMVTGKPDAAHSDKVWDELILDYRTTKSVEEKLKQSSAVATTSYVPSLPGGEAIGIFSESEDQLVKKGDGNCLSSPDGQSVKQLVAAKVVVQTTDEITSTNSVKPVELSSHHDDSLSETSSRSEVPQSKDQVSSRVGRITCVQKYYLKIICTGWAKPLAIFWNHIYVHGQCAENIYDSLQKGPFKKGDMINFYLANNEFITLAWLGKKPKKFKVCPINIKNFQNGEDGESSVPVTSGSSCSSWSSTKDELVASSNEDDVLSENEVDTVFERATVSLGNWKDVKGADRVCSKKAFISGERGTVVNVIGTYGFIKQESVPKERDKSAVFFQKNAIRNWPSGASRLEEILKEGQHVWYVAIPTEKEKAKSKWLALHVWISPCCRNNTCCGEAEVKAQDEWLMENTVPWLERLKVFEKKGTLHPHSLTEATIVGEGNERVLALSCVVFGSDYQLLDEKAWILASRSQVMYNAIFDSDCPARFNWKATVVCLDDKIPLSIPDAASDEHLWGELMSRYRSTPIVNLIRNSVAVNDLPLVQDVVVSSGSASDSGSDSIYDSSDKEIPPQATHASETTDSPGAETNLVQLVTSECDDTDSNQETLRDCLNDPQHKPSFAEGSETMVNNGDDDCDSDNSLFQFPAEEEHSKNSKLSVSPKGETDEKLNAELEEVAYAPATSPLDLQGPVSHCATDHNMAFTTVQANERFKEAAENLGSFSVPVDYIFSDLLPTIASCVLENISETSLSRQQLVHAIADAGRKIFTAKHQEFNEEHGRVSLPLTPEESLSKNVQIKHCESYTQTEEELLVVAAQTSSDASSSWKQQIDRQTQTYVTGSIYFSEIYHEN